MAELTFPPAEWQAAAIKLAMRAEDLPDPAGTYADTVFVESLKANSNQIVFGRRGTGKTHLLKRLESEFQNSFDQLHIVPVFIDGSAIRNNVDTQSNPSATALTLYVEFMRSLTRGLWDFIEHRIDPGFWDRVLRGPQSDLARKAVAITERLHRILSEGELRFLPVGAGSKELKTVNEAAQTARAELGADAGLTLTDPGKLGLKLNASVAREAKRQMTGLTTSKIEGQIILPLNEIAKQMQSLLDLLDDASLVVLFDEWSDLGDFEVQPLLANLLKATLRRRMFVKLACVPGRTKLATPKTAENLFVAGYEEGEDIFVGANLDSIVYVENDLAQLLPFFLSVLRKHLAVSLKPLNDATENEFADYAMSSIFDRPDTFNELCQASGGVVRDFLNIFRSATVVQQSSAAGTEQAPARSRISILSVRLAAKQVYGGKRSGFSEDSTELITLDRIYRRIVVEKQSYYFLVDRTMAADSSLVALFMAKLVHWLPATYFNPIDSKEYRYYQIDYGSYVDLLAHEEKEKGSAAGRALVDLLKGWPLLAWVKHLEEPIQVIAGFAAERAALAKREAGRLDRDPTELIIDATFVGNGRLPRKQGRTQSRPRSDRDANQRRD